MFKKDVAPSAKTKLKSSAQRNIRQLICNTYPLLAPHIDVIIPKKAQLDTVKLSEQRALLYVLDGKPLFYQIMSDPPIPHLSLVHAYPDFWPRLRVDRGAIRFVISGASIMAPGFTSPGGRLPSGTYQPGPAETDKANDDDDDSTSADASNAVPSAMGTTPKDDNRYLDQPDFAAGTVVIVEAEGKDHACAVGPLKMSSSEMKASKKGIGIENAHYVGDGLWRLRFD